MTPKLVAEIVRAGGDVETNSETEQSGVYLSDEDVDATFAQDSWALPPSRPAPP